MRNKVIRYGQIRQYVSDNIRVCSNQTNPFLYAYHMLLTEPDNGASCENIALPDFMQWDLRDKEHFSDLIDMIPIREQENDLIPLQPFDKEDDSLLYLPSTVPFFISRELPCTRMQPLIDDCFTIFYVYSGTCILQIDGIDHSMETGEMCIISPHTMRCHTLGKDDFVIGILIHRPAFEHALFRALRKNNPLSDFFKNALFHSEKGYLLFVLPPSPDLSQIFQHLFQEFTRHDLYSHDLFEEYLDLLFILIMRNLEQPCSYCSDDHMPVFMALPHILAYIQKHFATITMEQLAKTFHYDRSYLSRQLRRHTGKTYTRILAECRLEKAKEYLSFTELKISEIADRTGFHSADHFTRFFRNETGFSPREYKKHHQTSFSR